MSYRMHELNVGDRSRVCSEEEQPVSIPAALQHLVATLRREECGLLKGGGLGLCKGFLKLVVPF